MYRKGSASGRKGRRHLDRRAIVKTHSRQEIAPTVRRMVMNFAAALSRIGCLLILKEEEQCECQGLRLLVLVTWRTKAGALAVAALAQV